MAAYVRIGIGAVSMLLACGFAWRRGSAPVRAAVGLVAVCWTAGILLQFATGHTVEPVIASDIVIALGLLRLAWLKGVSWLWVGVAIEAAVLMIHAVFFHSGQPPTPLLIFANNGLMAVGLVAIVMAAIRYPREPAV